MCVGTFSGVTSAGMVISSALLGTYQRWQIMKECSTLLCQTLLCHLVQKRQITSLKTTQTKVKTINMHTATCVLYYLIQINRCAVVQLNYNYSNSTFPCPNLPANKHPSRNRRNGTNLFRKLLTNQRHDEGCLPHLGCRTHMKTVTLKLNELVWSDLLMTTLALWSPVTPR